MKSIFSTFGGVLVGAIYGLIMRILLGVNGGAINIPFPDLFSITFFVVVPFIIGICPMFVASKEQLESWSYRIWTPFLSVLFLFLICSISRIEDIICLLIISVPFILVSALSGLIFSKIILNYRKKNGILYSMFFIPILAGVVEMQLSTPSKVYEIKTSTLINATSNTVWANIVRVKRIEETEYNKGFFNLAGIPRPIYAELNEDTVGATRIGHFEDGLIFQEKVLEWDKNKKVAFSIVAIPSSFRNTVFDQHILKGNHFKFLNASYELRQKNRDCIELILTSSYQLDTRINIYASFWGNLLLSDFQERLLDVIKMKCEQQIQLEIL